MVEAKKIGSFFKKLACLPALSTYVLRIFLPKITGKAGLCYGLSGFYLLHKTQKILGTKEFLRLKRDYGLSGLRLKRVSLYIRTYASGVLCMYRMY